MLGKFFKRCVRQCPMDIAELQEEKQMYYRARKCLHNNLLKRPGMICCMALYVATCCFAFFLNWQPNPMLHVIGFVSFVSALTACMAITRSLYHANFAAQKELSLKIRELEKEIELRMAWEFV